MRRGMPWPVLIRFAVAVTETAPLPSAIQEVRAARAILQVPGTRDASQPACLSEGASVGPRRPITGSLASESEGGFASFFGIPEAAFAGHLAFWPGASDSRMSKQLYHSAYLWISEGLSISVARLFQSQSADQIGTSSKEDDL
jgi:hypothetical protein